MSCCLSFIYSVVQLLVILKYGVIASKLLHAGVQTYSVKHAAQGNARTIFIISK